MLLVTKDDQHIAKCCTLIKYIQTTHNGFCKFQHKSID